MADRELKQFLREVLPNLSESTLNELLQFFRQNDVIAFKDLEFIKVEDLKPFMSSIQAQKLVRRHEELTGSAPVTEQEKNIHWRAELKEKLMRITAQEKAQYLGNRNVKDTVGVVIAGGAGALMGAGSLALAGAALAITAPLSVPVLLGSCAAGVAVGGVVKAYTTLIDRANELAKIDQAGVFGRVNTPEPICG